MTTTQSFLEKKLSLDDINKSIDKNPDLFVNIFGEKGKHARFAVGAPALPRNVPVEIEGIFEIDN